MKKAQPSLGPEPMTSRSLLQHSNCWATAASPFNQTVDNATNYSYSNFVFMSSNKLNLATLVATNDLKGPALTDL